MKIIIAHTNYPLFLKSFYVKYPNWSKFSYKKIIKLWSNELFGSSNFYSTHLNKLGWEVFDILIDDRNSQNVWSKENKFNNKKLVDKLLSHIPFFIKTRAGIVDTWIFDVFLEQVKYYKPEVVYMHHLGLLQEKQLTQIKKHCKLLVGQIASPLPNSNLLHKFDLIVTSMPHFVKKLRKNGISSEYLKWAFEKSIPKTISKNERIYDVSYVGAFSPHHSEGNKILETLAKKIKVEFWGYAENFLSLLSPIKKTFNGQAWGKDMYTIFSKSKIVINRHINVAGNYANNMRLYEATGMGALLITDFKKNISDFFKDGKEIITYKNSDDLIKKVKYYINNEEERIKIAKAGQLKTLNYHNYTIRMRELNDILLKYLR